MAHGHGHLAAHGRSRTGDDTPPWVRWLLVAVVGVIALTAAVGLWLLRPQGTAPKTAEGLGLAPGVTLLDGRVEFVAPLDCDQMGFSDEEQPPRPPSASARCGRAEVTVLSGAEAGTTISVDLPPQVRRAGTGLPIIVMKVPGEGEDVTYSFYDVERSQPLLVMALLFVVVVVAVARWRGVRSLIGLGVAAYAVVEFLLPALLEGRNPVALGLVVSAAIMIVVLYLTHGVSIRTTTALLGTFAGLAITAVVGTVAVNLTHLTGASSEESFALQQVAGQLDLRHVLTCGIILAGLGILNDVTITQSSAVWELHEVDGRMDRARLYRQGMRIGRDHIASTVYTIVFAYAGAALSVLLLISLADAPLSLILTSNDIAEELVRTMASAIGLVLAVPATTALAVLVVGTARSRGAGDPAGDDEDSGDPEPSEHAVTVRH